VDAFAGRAYAGKVASVSKLSRPISQRSPVKYFEAQVALDESDAERLRPGMEGEAEVRLGKTIENALIIPRAAVHGEGDQSFVLVAGPRGKHEHRGVKLAGGDLVRVAVESGLTEGERVLLGEVADPGAGAGPAASPADGAASTKPAGKTTSAPGTGKAR
jgi:hypothetical protein